MTVEEEFNPSSVFGHMDIHGAGPRIALALPAVHHPNVVPPPVRTVHPWVVTN